MHMRPSLAKFTIQGKKFRLVGNAMEGDARRMSLVA